jgi:hypothetical protein
MKVLYSVDYKVDKKDRKKGMKTWFDNFYWLKIAPVIAVAVLGVIVPLILVFKTDFPDGVAVILMVVFAIIATVCIKLIEPSETKQDWHIANDIPDKEKMTFNLTDEFIVIRPDTNKSLEEAMDNDGEMSVYYFKDGRVKAIETKKYFTIGSKSGHIVETVPKDELDDYAEIQIREVFLKEFAPKRFIDKTKK